MADNRASRTFAFVIDRDRSRNSVALRSSSRKLFTIRIPEKTSNAWLVSSANASRILAVKRLIVRLNRFTTITKTTQAGATRSVSLWSTRKRRPSAPATVTAFETKPATSSSMNFSTSVVSLTKRDTKSPK